MTVEVMTRMLQMFKRRHKRTKIPPTILSRSREILVRRLSQHLTSSISLFPCQWCSHWSQLPHYPRYNYPLSLKLQSPDLCQGVGVVGCGVCTSQPLVSGMSKTLKPNETAYWLVLEIKIYNFYKLFIQNISISLQLPLPSAVLMGMTIQYR